jgi:hypothetical protein
LFRAVSSSVSIPNYRAISNSESPPSTV